MLMYKPKKEQSSPINPDSRKQYDRTFLLQLQYAPQSMMKPANLPDIPDMCIIIEKTATNYSQRMSSPVFQNSMSITQLGSFQMPQQNTTNFAHTHTYTYNSPPAVFYNQAALQQNRPPMISDMSGPGQQPTKKRECTMLQLIDPNSGKGITQEILQACSTLASHSTPVSGQEASMQLPSYSVSQHHPIQGMLPTPQQIMFMPPGQYCSDGAQVIMPEASMQLPSYSVSQHHPGQGMLPPPQQIMFMPPGQYCSDGAQVIMPEASMQLPSYSVSQHHPGQGMLPPPQQIMFMPPGQYCSDGAQVIMPEASMQLPSYSVSQHHPIQGMLPTPQQIMFMPPGQYCSDGAQVIMPETATNYSQRMSSPVFQNSMPSTQQGLFQLPQLNTTNFTHTHTDTYNSPSAVFYNQAALQQNRPPMISSMSGPGQQPTKKRERTMLQLIDPNSGKDITQEILQACSTLASHSTPVSGQEISHITQNEIAAQFATQVAQVALTTRRAADQQRTMAEAAPSLQPSSFNVSATHQQHPPLQGSVDNIASVITNVSETKMPTEAETSMPGEEKEIQYPTESIPDKFGAREMTATPPIVDEEVVPTVDINTEDVDSSDTSIAVENERKEKRKLKYKYKEDQSSPISLESKKQYDRDFLLQLQNAPESTLKPFDLPDTTYITIKQSGGIPCRASNQRGEGGLRGSTSQTNDINLSIQEDIQMHHTKEAWKPTHQTDKMDQIDEDLKSEELYEKVRSILNKPTPQKFQTLVAKMQALQIDTETRLKTVIDLVFETAIGEQGQTFIVAYASMCRCLSQFKVPAETKQGDVNFQALLLTKCQWEFKRAISSIKEFDSKRKEIEKAATEEERQQMNKELEYEEMKAKRRSLGNIRLIGELFKLKMLTENIMHDCVFKLLKGKFEENLECLCILLKTVGKELETEKAKQRMDQYFVQMQKIVNENKLSPGVCFMLQDVIELRQNKWVPRRCDNNPKTVDQICQETAQEEQDLAILIQNLPQAEPKEEKLFDSGKDDREKTQTGGKSKDHPSKNNTSHMEEIFKEIKQFHLQSRKKKSGHTEQLSPIGPDGRKQYDRVFLLQLQYAPQSMLKPANLPNISDTCIIIEKTAANYSQRMPSPVFQNSMPTIQLGLFQMPQQNTTNFTYTHTHTYNDPPAVFYNQAAQQQNRPPVTSRMSCPGQQPTKKLERRLLQIINPNSGKDITQEILQIRSAHPSSDTLASHSTPAGGQESTEQEASPPGVGKENQDPNKGTKTPDKFGAMDSTQTPPHVDIEAVPKMDIRTEDVDSSEASNVWSGQSQKLEFTKSRVIAPTSPTTGMPILVIEDSLNILILNKGCSNEEVFNWIEGNVDEPTTKCEHFIRALMTAVCRSAIAVSNKNLMNVDKSQIQRRNNLLQKYLDQQADFELQALYALQALVHKLQHPPGVFCELFEILYDEDIISEDAFIQWEKSEDPQEQEGKSMSMKEVVKFFTWLKDAEDEEIKCLPGRDGNNPKTIDKIHQEVAQEEDDKAILIRTMPQAKTQVGNVNYSILNKSVKEGDEKSMPSLLCPSSSGNSGQGVIQLQQSSTSRKLSIESLEREVRHLEKVKLQLEIEFIKLKHKKVMEETEVLNLQKELLKLNLNS